MHKKVTADKPLLITIIILLVFGLVMIYDATAIYSKDTFGGAYRFVLLQFIWMIFGFLGLLAFYKLDYHKIGKVAYALFGVTIIVLFVLAVIGMLPCDLNIIFTPCINGANRWVFLNPSPLPKLPLLGVLGFQPSELAKFALILYLSVQLSKQKENGFWIYFIISGLTSFFVLLQPNMSTSVIIFLIGSIIYFSSNGTLKPFALLIPSFGLLSTLFVLISPYRRDRLVTFLSGSDDSGLSIGYHIKQILIALGSGGLFGVGFGQSRQKFQYLPETSADSIFAVIGEELGFVGTTLVVLLFAFLLYRGIEVAKKSPDMLGRLLCVGVTSWIGIQFFVNIGAMTKIIPLTGVPIPLISYGGSSLVFTMMGLGILLNVSKQSK